MRAHFILAVAVAAAVAAAPFEASAYMGPGAGLGLLGSLLAVVAVVLVALFGLVILPFRMLLKRRKANSGQLQDSGKRGNQAPPRPLDP